MGQKELQYYRKQLEYIEKMGYSVDDMGYIELFPVGWNLTDNYELQTQILEEATAKQCLIVDTDIYQNTMMERVIYDDERKSL